MKITVKHFLVDKDGQLPEHNDDAAAAELDRRRFAISDGAAESGFARRWSQLLVEQFVKRTDSWPDDWSAWLPLAQQCWCDELKGVKIPWYGENQFEQGAFATFLALVLTDSGESDCHWHASAVGDSCLFHTRGDRLLASFPLEHSSQFDSFPCLIGSRSSVAEIAQKRAKSRKGSGQTHDCLWLMSDALSQWCFFQLESGRPPWPEMAELVAPTSSEEQFAGWIDQLRTHRGLQNDDVVLMAIHL